MKMATLRRWWSDFAKSGTPGAYAFNAYHWVRALILSLQSDETFAQRSYRRFSGEPLDLVNPRTFDERQWWLKIHYRDPLMRQCTDKVAVRDYVEQRGLGHILLPLLGVYERPEDIDWSRLPKGFYLKTNCASATNIRCDDLDSLDKSAAIRRLRLYLRRQHYPLSREWNYRDIQPKVLVEPIIETDTARGLVDYRFLCSYGRCHGIFADVDTAAADGRHRSDARRNVYDPDWHLLDVQVTRPRIVDHDLRRPDALDEMVRIAETLSGPFPFCRVDLYNPEGDQIIFGEITFFHAGGNNRIQPQAFQYTMGEWVAMGQKVEG